MAEVGLLPFARIALQVSKAVLPCYRSRFSKHQFTQPQLLAILCLMRYEDWTFRETEVRLGEHRELRQALGLTSVPDFTTLYRFLQRLDDQIIDQAVGDTVRRLRGTGRKGRRRARVGVDATGLAQGAVSTFFVRRLHHHGQKPLPWRHWLKWVVVADLDQQFLLSQTARRGPWNDCANLPAVVETASQQTPMGLVLADAEFDSERNHTYIRQKLGAHSVIPAKRGKKTWRVRGVRAEMRRAFPSRLYRRRALIESVFSSVKRKLSARAPGRSLRMQVRQALLLGLSFNLYRLKHLRSFLRMSTEPDNLYTIQCNWKVYVDNYLEGYHIPIAHPGLMKEIDYAQYHTEAFRYHSQQFAPVRAMKADEGDARIYPPDTGLNEALYFWVFPNLMLNLYPDNVQMNLIVPLSHDKTLTIFEWYFHDKESTRVKERIQKAVAFSHQVQQEDISLCESVQRGLQSAIYDRGRYSVKREDGVHHFHMLLSEFLR